MGFGRMFCNTYMVYLSQRLPRLKYVYAHENGIKDVPIKEITAALSIKKAVVGNELPQEEGTGNPERRATVTLGINFYTPSSMGVSAGVAAFDDVMNAILEESWDSLTEIRLLGTGYSREAQALVTKAEFDFIWYVGKPFNIRT